MMRVRFWGTRGALPIALTAADVRRKVRAALRGASGRHFGDDADPLGRRAARSLLDLAGSVPEPS